MKSQLKFKVIELENKRDVFVREDRIALGTFNQAMPREVGVLLGAAPEMKKLLEALVEAVAIGNAELVLKIAAQAKEVTQGIDLGSFIEKHNFKG